MVASDCVNVVHILVLHHGLGHSQRHARARPPDVEIFEVVTIEARIANRERVGRGLAHWHFVVVVEIGKANKCAEATLGEVDGEQRGNCHRLASVLVELEDRVHNDLSFSLAKDVTVQEHDFTREVVVSEVGLVGAWIVGHRLDGDGSAKSRACWQWASCAGGCVDGSLRDRVDDRDGWDAQVEGLCPQGVCCRVENTVVPVVVVESGGITAFRDDSEADEVIFHPDVWVCRQVQVVLPGGSVDASFRVCRLEQVFLDSAIRINPGVGGLAHVHAILVDNVSK